MTNADVVTPVVPITGSEMFESLTGFEELAISKAFGHEITSLIDTSPSMFGRALVFAHRTRGGDDPLTAKKAAMTLTLKAVNGYFQREPDGDEEPGEQEPDSAVGEGDSSDA